MKHRQQINAANASFIPSSAYLKKTKYQPMPFVTLHFTCLIYFYYFKLLRKIKDCLISEISGNSHDLHFLMLTPSRCQYVGHLSICMIGYLFCNMQVPSTTVPWDFPVAYQALSLPFLFSSSFSPQLFLKKEDGTVWEWAVVGIPTDCKIQNNK